jgi:sRNA-binding regulator protein Hfq
MKASKTKNLLMSGVVLAALLMISLTVSIQSVQAAGEAKQYVQLNAGITLADNLTALKGKTVTIYLASGQSMTGIVKDVKDNVLHLEKISQKEFYDALIRVDLISAIEARVR